MSTKASHPSPAEWTLAMALLQQAPLAYIAMVETARPDGSAAPDGSARPYVVPMNFAYEPTEALLGAVAEARTEAPTAMGRLFIHTGEGRKTEALARHPRVCMAITADESFDQGANPCEDGFAFRSVLIEGRALLLEDEGQRETALRAIVVKYDPSAAALPLSEAVLAKTLVYAITIETLTYRERPRRSAPPAADASL